MGWQVESEVDLTDTAQIVHDLLKGPLPPLPPREQKLGSSVVRWWEGRVGDAVVMAEGGSPEDRTLAEQVVAAQLEIHGYKRARFTFDETDGDLKKLASWTDIMAKAKRLILSQQVTVLRNGWNNIVGHVIGDHGEYNTEIGRDDPNSRTITTWQCECPWDQYAWQRTRKWKKYEGRPCAHVMALYWKSLATPLDDYNPQEHGPMTPGQNQGPPSPGGGGPMPPEGPTPATPTGPPEVPEAPPVPQGPAGMQPPGPPAPPGPPGMPPPGPPGVLPPSPAEQLQMLQPPAPGMTPGGMPSGPGSVSVPGAKMPSPFNPMQWPGGTYSKVAADYAPTDVVRLKDDGYGTAVGKSEPHGAGQPRLVPAGTRGEVVGQDQTTGWVEVLFPIEDAGPMEPYHVQMFCEPTDLERSRTKNEQNVWINRR